MKGKSLNTIGLTVFSLLGLGGALLKWRGFHQADFLIWIGFIGFPILYGYITWPVGKKTPDREWWGTMSVMVIIEVILMSRLL